jgi:hypothetical protein
MTTRRDFLKGLGVVVGAITIFPASALAELERIGGPRRLIEQPQVLDPLFVNGWFTVKPGLQDARLDDPRSFVENDARYAAGQQPQLPADGSHLRVSSGTSVMISEPTPWFGEVTWFGGVTIDAARGGLLRMRGPFQGGGNACFRSITVDSGVPVTRNLSRLTSRVVAPRVIDTTLHIVPRVR